MFLRIILDLRDDLVSEVIIGDGFGDIMLGSEDDLSLSEVLEEVSEVEEGRRVTAEWVWSIKLQGVFLEGFLIGGQV